jgi:hypothetical protein
MARLSDGVARAESFQSPGSSEPMLLVAMSTH